MIRPSTRNGTPRSHRSDSTGFDSLWTARAIAEQIKTADLVANPAAIPAPRFSAGSRDLWRIVEPTGIIIEPKAASVERTNSKAEHAVPRMQRKLWGLQRGTHRHMPEIEQVLTQARVNRWKFCLLRILFRWTGHPGDNLCQADAPVTQEELIAEYRFYSGNRLSASWIIFATKDSAYTNFCDITVRVVKGRVRDHCLSR